MLNCSGTGFYGNSEAVATKTTRSATGVGQVGKGGGLAPQKGLSFWARVQGGAKQGNTHSPRPHRASRVVIGMAQRFCVEGPGHHECYLCPIL